MFDLRSRAEATAFKVHKSISNVSEIVDLHLKTYGTRPAIRFDVGTGYRTMNFQEYLGYIQAMISFLEEQDEKQKVIATLCKNRVEWDMVAMASFYTANIIFPLDTKTNPVELDHLLGLCKPDYILTSFAQLPRVRELSTRHRLHAKILVADIFEVFEDIGFEKPKLLSGESRMKDILIEFQGRPISPSPLLDFPNTVLGYYPTSGTTSLPKIVKITHGNIVAEVNCAFEVLNLRTNEDLLNIGPYTHIATLVEFLVTKTRGFTVTYFTREPDDDDVLEGEIEKLKKLDVRIKALMAVPKFWIYLLKEVLEEMKNKPVLRNLYQHLTSIEKNGQLHDIGTIEKAKLTAVRILLRNKLGGYFSYGISSSMKIDAAIVEIFGKLGITVLDIYGATECSGIISRNKLNEIHPGSCGKIIDALDYRLSGLRKIKGVDQEVGILEVKGPTIAHSYLKADNGEEPMALDGDGYLATGDLAWVDERRLVHLIGREKELIHWKDGSYIDPQYLSNLLVRSIFIKDAMVAHTHPENDFLSVFVYPDFKRISKDPTWRTEIHTGVSEDEALKARILDAIRYAESVSGISASLDKDAVFILPNKLERTPTHKIKFLFEMKRLHLAKKI